MLKHIALNKMEAHAQSVDAVLSESLSLSYALAQVTELAVIQAQFIHPVVMTTPALEFVYFVSVLIPKVGVIQRRLKYSWK